VDRLRRSPANQTPSSGELKLFQATEPHLGNCSKPSKTPPHDQNVASLPH
jgi:hypothetical protein